MRHARGAVVFVSFYRAPWRSPQLLAAASVFGGLCSPVGGARLCSARRFVSGVLCRETVTWVSAEHLTVPCLTRLSSPLCSFVRFSLRRLIRAPWFAGLFLLRRALCGRRRVSLGIRCCAGGCCSLSASVGRVCCRGVCPSPVRLRRRSSDQCMLRSPCCAFRLPWPHFWR